MENKLKKHKRRFKIYNIISIIISFVITFLLFTFMYGWAKGDWNDVSFTSTALFLFIGIAFGFYVTLMMPAYIIYKIQMAKDKNKKTRLL